MNELVTKRIPEIEQKETAKRISADMSRLHRYLTSTPKILLDNIEKEATEYLSDPTTYIDLLQYADMDSISVDELDVNISPKDMEIHSVDEDDIEALCFVDIDAKVSLKYLNENESIWDSEEKEYMFKSYSSVNLDLSSVLPVTFLFPRLSMEDENETHHWNSLDIEIVTVDFINLQEVIDDYWASNDNSEESPSMDIPKLAKDMSELKEKVESMTDIINKKPK